MRQIGLLIRIFVSMLIFSIFGASASMGGVRLGDWWSVSVIELNITPQKYSNKKVIISGYASDFGGVPNVYLTKEHAEMFDHSSSIPIIGLPPKVIDVVGGVCNNKYVKTHGIFKWSKLLGRWALSEVNVIYEYQFDAPRSGIQICWARKELR